MKLVIAGSRNAPDMSLPRLASFADEALHFWGLEWEEIRCIIHGGARGIDRLGKELGEYLGLEVVPVIPDYATHGRYLAPKIRNAQMAEMGDRLIAVRYMMSGGTSHMIEQMCKQGKPVFVKEIS